MKPFSRTSLKFLFPLALTLAAAVPVVAQVLNEPPGVPAPTGGTGTSEVTDPAAASFSQITRIYGNWSMQCSERSGDERCFVETVVRQSKPQVRDVVVLRFSQSENGMRATIVTPNRVKLDRGVVLSVGDASFQAAYSICGPVNCNALLEADASLEEALRGGTELGVSFYIFAPTEESGEREIRIPVSLTGFAPAYDNLAVFDAAQ